MSNLLVPVLESGITNSKPHITFLSPLIFLMTVNNDGSDKLLLP